VSEPNEQNPFFLDQQRAKLLRPLNRPIPYSMVKLYVAWRKVRREYPESAQIVANIENVDVLIAYLERMGWLKHGLNRRVILCVTDDGRPSAHVRLACHISIFRLLNRDMPYMMGELYAAWREIVRSHPDSEVVADLKEAGDDFVIHLAQKGWLKKLSPNDPRRIVRVPNDGRMLSIPPPPPGLKSL